MKKLVKLTALGLALASGSAMASDSLLDYGNGYFYVGAGIVDLKMAGCDECGDATGVGFDVTYDINRFVGVEAAYQTADFDDFKSGKLDYTHTYAGVTLGTDFDTGWLRLYGKYGLSQVELEQEAQGSDSEISPVVGFGVRIEPQGENKGIYFKFERMIVNNNGLADDLNITSNYFGIGAKF